MAFRSARPHLISILLLAVVLSFFPKRVGADGSVQLPPLGEFASAVSNGEVDTLRGIYVPDVLAGWIVSQPEGEPAFVSADENTLTLFEQAASVGSTGLLAHNYLAGKTFSRVKEGQVFYLVYGDGSTRAFIVTQVLRFHALDPESVWSNFVDLKGGDIFSASNLFSKVYARPGHVILQTCIESGGESSWGRLFVIAEPYMVNTLEVEADLTSFR